MKITGNITKQGQTAGVRIEDGNDTHYIQLDSLTCRDIFEGLIESGYTYASYPHGFTKDGKSIQDLEEVPYDSLSQAEKNDFAIPPSNDLMSETELRAALPMESTNVTLLPKVENPIKTREEFLAFLLSTPGSTQIIDNPMSYLPLNYLVSDEALFTHGEYFNKRNEKYRELIERREKLSFECYRKLIEWMMEIQALNPNFSALDFKKGYYSWGVPGIRTKVISLKEERSCLKIMHSTIKNNLKMTAAVHYFGRNKKLDPPLRKGQELIVDHQWIDNTKLTLEDDEIALVTTIAPAANNIVTVVCDGFTLEFDDLYRRIIQKDNKTEFVDPILQIRASGGGELDTKFYNTVRQETKEAYWNDLMCSSCVEKLVEKTTVETCKSSFVALQEGLSLSPAAAIKYLVARLALRANHHVDDFHDSPIDGNDEESREILNAYQAAYQFLHNMLSVHAEDFDINSFSETFGADPFLVLDIIESIISGDLNIDDIENGYIADRSVSRAAIRNTLDFAVAKMGYSISDIVEIVNEFDPYEDSCMVFHKEGVGKLKLTLPVRKNQEDAYAGEVMNYKALCASTALTWNCVIKAMAEPGKNDGRHCAALLLTWTHRVSSSASQVYQPKIEDAIKALVMSSIDRINNDFQREAALRCADIAVANILFDVRLNGKTEFTLPEFFGGMTVTIPDSTVIDIRESGNFNELLESTYGLSECAVNGNDIVRYFVNARITPHYIIPNKGAKISEVPFLPMWKDLSGMDDLKQRYSALFPYAGFSGYGKIYHAMSAALPPKKDLLDYEPLKSPYSLREYYNALIKYRTDAMEKRSHHILTPPSLAEIDQPYFYSLRPNIPCKENEFCDKWLHSRARILTCDDEEVRDSGSTYLLEEFKPCVSWVKGFTLDDYTRLSKETAYDIFSACGSRIKAVQYLGDRVRFADGYMHNFRESEIDSSKYAVFETSGGTYIPFMNGKIAKTDSMMQ